MDYYAYFITPFFAWLTAGISKFIINSIKSKKFAFDMIGYGGLPSNHSAIVSSTAVLIALKEGVAHPAFGVAVTLAFIVMLDANSLRREIGKHAALINSLPSAVSDREFLRERIGHTRMEIAVGVVVGGIVAVIVNSLFG